MNKMMWAVMMMAVVFSASPVSAKDSSSSDDKSAQVQQKAPDVAAFDTQMTQAQENLKIMQEQMDKIQQTTDPKERQNLLEAHWSAMQNGMGMMQGMWNSCMMGGNMMNGGMMGGHMMGGHMMMGWKGMGDYYSKLTPEQMKQHSYMMDQYMGTQMMMMEQMMQHQHWMGMMQPQK